MFPTNTLFAFFQESLPPGRDIFDTELDAIERCIDTINGRIITLTTQVRRLDLAKKKITKTP